VEVAASEPFRHKRALAAKYGARVFDPAEFSRSTHGRKTYCDHIKEEFGEAEAVKAFEFYDRGEWIKILVEPFRE
jgi:hypothetical protein